MFATLHIPDFAITAALRNRPELKAAPCAILASSARKSPKDKLPLLSINPAARLTGIDIGWPLNRSLVRCPSLEVIPADPVAETSLRDELIRLGESLTPDMEITAVDTVTLDLSHSRMTMDQLQERLSLPDAELWHGIAGTPDLAHLSARHRELQGFTIVPASLHPLSIACLDIFSPSGNTLTTLSWWGMKTLGDFMNLPRQALTERLGLETGHWHDILHGKTCRLLRLHRSPESLSQRFDFEDAVVSLDPVIFALGRLLRTLAARLENRAISAGQLDLKLILESGSIISRRIQLPEPQHTVEGMLPTLLTWLESLHLDAAILSIELDAETTFSKASQHDWLRHELPHPARWMETLAKLKALLGPGNVGIPIPNDSHAPDAFTLRPVTENPGPSVDHAASPACPVPLQRFRPPRPIAVAHEWTDGRPAPLALLTGSHVGEIIDLRGPFPSSGNWWQSSETWQRLEWDIQLASRHLLRLVFETPDRWQLEGIYQ